MEPNNLKDIDKDPYWGVIDMGERETDYQVGAELKLPKPRNTYHMHRIEYHQPDVSPVSCTLHGALGALSDLSGVKASLEMREKLWKIAGERGATPVGWITARGVDLVREKAVEIIGEEVMSFRLSFLSEELYDALDAGYSAVMSFRGNKAYGVDKADGILHGESFGELNYGHCVRMVATVERDEYEIIIDNYVTTKGEKNRYKVNREQIKKLVKNGVFYENTYIYVFKRDFEKMDQETSVPVWAVKSWEKAIVKGIVKSEDDFNRVFADASVEQMFIKLGGLSKAEGGVSLGRMVVALDRLGIL